MTENLDTTQLKKNAALEYVKAIANPYNKSGKVPFIVIYEGVQQSDVMYAANDGEDLFLSAWCYVMSMREILGKSFEDKYPHKSWSHKIVGHVEEKMP